MKTVTFYSYKGGVGRSLALANIAIRLSEFGKNVCILDFDLEAPGLHFKFQDVDLDAKNLGTKNGIVDYIYEYYSLTNKRPEKLTDFIHSIKFSKKNYKPISLISAGNTNNAAYWTRLSRINWVDLLYKKDGILFLLDLKERIEKELKPDFLLIDSRTGFTDIAGITINLLADEVVILAANNSENLYGSKQLLHSLKDPSRNILNKEIRSIFVLTRIPHNSKLSYLKKVSKTLFDDYNKESDILVIHSDDELLLNESLKISSSLYRKGIYREELKKQSDSFSITKDYLKLFEAITKDDLSSDDIKKFNDLKEVERLLDEANDAEKLDDKLSLIDKAIAIDNNFLEAYIEKAGILLDNLKFLYKNVNLFNECLDKIFEIEPDNLKGIIMKLHLYYIMPQKFNIAKEKGEILAIADKLIVSEEVQVTGYKMKSNILEYLQNYDEAIKNIESALKIKPDDPTLINSFANVLKKQNITKAFEKIYDAISQEPKRGYFYLTLAEIYALSGNKNEFYKNFELGLILDKSLASEDLEFFIVAELDSYKDFFEESRFLKLLEKYKIDFNLIKQLISELEKPERLILNN
jgi:MinD-like ATPase involved in chromosome partitioning or flagellar assembly